MNPILSTYDDTPPLWRSLWAARGLALDRCPHAVGGNCDWYHGTWPFLRALGLIKRAGGQADFLDGAIDAAIDRGGTRRVLISGAADDEMGAIVQSAFRRRDSALDLTVLDRCPTPLARTRLRLKHEGKENDEGTQLTTVSADILGYESLQPFDLLLANSFLGYFPRATWPTLFDRWAKLLRPGGLLALSQRLRPDAPEGPTGFDAESAQAFCSSARRAAELRQDELGIEPAHIERWVADYASRLQTWALRDADEVRAPLRAAGFEIERLEISSFAGLPGMTSMQGPTSANPADYLRVVAVRV